MLTDDDLTRDLRAAFRDATEDLRYDGAAPTVRRTPAWVSYGWLALPAAAAVATVAVVAGGPEGAVAPPASPPGAAPGLSAPASPATSSAPEQPGMVTDEIEVAGFTLRHVRPASADPITVALTEPASLPDDAREVTTPEMEPARAWVGTDPATGIPVLYLKAPTRNDGKLFGLSSRDLDEDGLVDLLVNGSAD